MNKMPRVIQCMDCDRIIEQPIMDDAEECCRLSLAMEIIAWIKSSGTYDKGLAFDAVVQMLQRALGVPLPGYLKDMMHRLIIGTFLAETLQVDFDLILREAEERLGE